MKRSAFKFALLAVAVAMLSSVTLFAQRRRALVRHPIARHALVMHAGHPIRRLLPTEVVLRPARHLVTVRGPLTYLPLLTWRATVAPLPPSERLAWQDSETIDHDEEWVDTNFGIDAPGKALFLDLDGKAKLNFAEVTFINGNVQVIDFNEKTHGPGVYELIDFPDGRHVSTVRILAKSESDETRVSVYLSK